MVDAISHIEGVQQHAELELLGVRAKAIARLARANEHDIDFRFRGIAADMIEKIAAAFCEVELIGHVRDLEGCRYVVAAVSIGDGRHEDHRHGLLHLRGIAAREVSRGTIFDDGHSGSGDEENEEAAQKIEVHDHRMLGRKDICSIECFL